MLLADSAGAPGAAVRPAGCLACGQAQRAISCSCLRRQIFQRPRWSRCFGERHQVPKGAYLLLQEHPWFRTALPGTLTSVDEYNAHYVELSKAPDLLVSRESIKSVMQVTQ